MKVQVQFLLLSVLLGLCSTAAFADGLPPSEETVCDALLEPGVTPGLFGICNAYCEAKDCDAYPAGEEPNSCNRLLANYERRASESDPVMPCLQEETYVCPCWPPESGRFGDEVDEGMGLPAAVCVFNDPGFGTAMVYDDGENMILFIDTPNGCEYINDLTGDGDALGTTPEEDAVCSANVLQLINEELGGTGSCF